MVKRAPGMSVPARAALMAWFLLMARKLTRGHRPVEMTWSDVRQWLSKVAIVVEDSREKTEEIINMVGEIKMIVKQEIHRIDSVNQS